MKERDPPNIGPLCCTTVLSYKTKKERDPPNICLSLLHDRFRREFSTLRRLLC